jgi:glycine cleavage system H lipoate-binding protein
MDFLPTKGIEYLLVIGYLLLLIPFWLLVQRGARRPAAVPATATAPARPAAAARWFALPGDRYFHRGHAWAQPRRDGLFRMGVDDFASKLVGRPEGVELPAVGERLAEGRRALALRAGGQKVDVLSAVDGEVAAVNREVERDPRLVADDPYGRGWLLEVRVPQAAAAIKNLLPRRLAAVWTELSTQRLLGMMGGDLGLVLQDGGFPVSGIARQLSPEGWPAIAAELLLTADVTEANV